MHWIEFIAVEHNHQRMREVETKAQAATVERESSLKEEDSHSGRNIIHTVDLGGLGATGIVGAPCPGHAITVVDDAICRDALCSSSVSCCIEDHSSSSSFTAEEVDRSDHIKDTPTARNSLSSLLTDDSTTPSVRTYGSIHHHTTTTTNNNKRTSTQVLVRDVSTSTEDNHHHHHYPEIGHSHAHGLELLGDSQRKISTYILEAGVAAHSIIIGISLGVSSGAEFTSLLTALAFHQFFE
ncbi:high-affinity Zn(2+) transporter zrt1, partial [Modicella reniformis]